MPALAAVGFIDDHGKISVGQIADLVEQEREFLQGRDDDFRALVEFIGQIARIAVFVDFGYHALLVLNLIDVVLQLLVQVAAVRNDDHRVEDGTVSRVVCAGELMGEPRYGVGFARSRAVLDQVVVAHAFGPRVCE